MKVLVIIPCYNERDNIADVVAELRRAYPLADHLIVNDCSTDDCEAILQQGGFNYLSLPVNLGIGGGVQSGYLYAVERGYDITVQMDGDGQHDPDFLKNIVEPVAAGEVDMCVGSRFIEKEGFQTSALRRFGIRFLSGMIRLLTGQRVLDVTSGFRACNAELTAFYARNYAQDFPEPEAIIAAVTSGFSVGEAPVQMRERQGGVSSIRAWSSVYYMIKVSLSLFINRLVWTKKDRRSHRAEEKEQP